MRALLLFIAAIIAIFAGLMALQLSSKPSAVTSVVEQHDVPTVEVLVARTAIAPGTTITEAMVDTQPWPESLVLKNFIVRGSPDANIIGKVSRGMFDPGQPLLASKIASSTDAGFLAANLPQGMRAITIAVDAVAGVAGFVFPGDRVDIIFTHGDSEAGSTRKIMSEILIPSVLVLAVGGRDANSKVDAQASSSVVAPTTITLQVSAEEVQNIRLAEKAGSLSLSLRAINEAASATAVQPASLDSLEHFPVRAVAAPAVNDLADDTVTVTRR